MNHGLQLVLWYRGSQGHIWLKGQRANKLLSQITFSNCKSNAHILSKDVIFYSLCTWCFISLLIKIHCDSRQTGDTVNSCLFGSRCRAQDLSDREQLWTHSCTYHGKLLHSLKWFHLNLFLLWEQILHRMPNMEILWADRFGDDTTKVWLNITGALSGVVNIEAIRLFSLLPLLFVGFFFAYLLFVMNMLFVFTEETAGFLFTVI